MSRLSSKTCLLIGVCLIFFAVLVLLLMGRVPWYKYGTPGLWSGDTMSDQNSQQLFDPYTFTHILHGIGFYLLLWFIFGDKLPLTTRLLLALGLETGWEIIENTDFVINRYREATISLDYYGDSVLNVLGDLLACVVGFLAAARLPVWTSIVLVAAIEISLILLIRDSLILNIVMLLYPLSQIKAWQLGV